MFGDQPWATCYIIRRFKSSKYAFWDVIVNVFAFLTPEKRMCRNQMEKNGYFFFMFLRKLECFLS